MSNLYTLVKIQEFLGCGIISFRGVEFTLRIRDLIGVSKVCNVLNGLIITHKQVTIFQKVITVLNTKNKIIKNKLTIKFKSCTISYSYLFTTTFFMGLHESDGHTSKAKHANSVSCGFTQTDREILFFFKEVFGGNLYMYESSK
jgi:hypothetical protein